MNALRALLLAPLVLVSSIIVASPATASRPRVQAHAVPQVVVVPAPTIRAVINPALIRRAVRLSVLPRVRACFRDARAGRPHWSARAIAHFTVVHGQVRGLRVDAPTLQLQECVREAFGRLSLPDLEEPVTVSYPFVSAALAQPESTPIPDEVWARLDRALAATR